MSQRTRLPDIPSALQERAESFVDSLTRYATETIISAVSHGKQQSDAPPRHTLFPPHPPCEAEKILLTHQYCAHVEEHLGKGMRAIRARVQPGIGYATCTLPIFYLSREPGQHQYAPPGFMREIRDTLPAIALAQRHYIAQVFIQPGGSSRGLDRTVAMVSAGRRAGSLVHLPYIDPRSPSIMPLLNRKGDMRAMRWFAGGDLDLLPVEHVE